MDCLFLQKHYLWRGVISAFIGNALITEANISRHSAKVNALFVDMEKMVLVSGARI